MPRRDDIHKILLIGSGPIVIGQACEFDYSGSVAARHKDRIVELAARLVKLGFELIATNGTAPGAASHELTERRVHHPTRRCRTLASFEK